MELRAAIDAQKKRVLDLRAQHDQIDILKQDVATAQRAYDMVAQRMSQTTLESHSQQTNLSVLSPATEPTVAARPKVMVNVAASVLVGLLLGLGAAIARESIDRRIRHHDDLDGLSGVPVLGVLRPKVEYQYLSGRWAAAAGWLARRFGNRRPTANMRAGA